MTLLVLLAVEGVTILFLGPLLSWHVFVGMMLIPPVALKLASTGYRFARYYGRSRAYLLRGPPHPLMRFVVAPVLIASTFGVLATGVAMLAVGRHGIVPGLHKVSFLIWAGAFAIHVLVYSLRLPRLIRADLRRRRRGFGRLLRGVALGGVLAAGAVLALATRPLAAPLFHHRHHDERTARALPRTAVRNARGVESRRRVSESPAVRALGLPPVGPGPIPGYVLIADRNANKLLIVSPTKRIVWQFPRAGDVRPGQSFADPDDAFFAPGYSRIVTNEEFNDAIAQIDIRSRRIVWSYGLPGVAGSGAGELSNPDDAYVWPDRTITVADIRNCRVLRLNAAKRVIGSVGSAGRCTHDPPAALLDPNGATPLPDGGMLITEIGGYVDRLDRHGRLVYSIRTPTSYPSDAQLLPDGNLLVAGFNTPGRVDILTPNGKVVWTYGPASGAGSLDRPSLAVRWPNGMIAVTDDWHHRIVVIDPRTKRIVWQYGHFGVASTADGYLSKPDGLDLLPAASTPVSSSRPAAGSPPRPVASPHVRRIGTLPAAVSRIAAVALPDGRLLAAGGLVSGGSSDEVLLGTPRRLRIAGRLPVGTHDAALALVGRSAYLFGGGEAASTDAIVRIDSQNGRDPQDREYRRAALRSRGGHRRPAHLPRRRLHRHEVRDRRPALLAGHPADRSRTAAGRLALRRRRRDGRRALRRRRSHALRGAQVRAES